MSKVGKSAFLSDGVVSPRTKGELVYNDSGGTLNPGDLVTFTGWYEPTDKPRDRGCRRVKKADADAADMPAQAVVRVAIPSGSQGRVFKTFRLTDQNTSAASAVDDPVYLSATAGAWTLTDPAAANARTQPVGRVAVKHASTGVVEFNVDEAPARGKIAASSLQSQAIAPTHVVVGASQAAGAFAASAGAIPIVFPLLIANAASGNNDFTGVPFKCRVIDVWSQNTAAGNAGNTYQVQTGAGAAVTDAFASAGGDNDIGRAGEIDDATYEFAAGATMRVAHVRAGGSSAAIVYVKVIRVA